jgi:uncharacterized glyoxalase superfamily protein PhnB
MLLLGSAGESAYDDLVTTARRAVKPTGGIYIIVDDVDGHAARAKAAGAEIVFEPVDQPYGGRGYTCRDVEGNIWSFGSYDPWAA